MLAEPMNQVSKRPRACSSRSVKTWPRSSCVAKLHFVDGYEIDLARQGHGFRRAHPIIRAPGHALLFTRDQGHAVLTDAQADTIVNFARQEP